MADITGPIRSLPGASHAVPKGTVCDDHPDRPATHRVQGETDSFGCELYDLCDECYVEWKAHGIYKPDCCDWCKKPADDCRPQRDYDEGLCGPVYYVCGKCRKRYAEELEEELRESGYYDDDGDYWEPDDDDPYVSGDAEFDQEVIEARENQRAPVRTTCRTCRQPWTPNHKHRAKLKPRC